MWIKINSFSQSPFFLAYIFLPWLSDNISDACHNPFLPRWWKHRITISLRSQCEHSSTHIHGRQLCILVAWLITATSAGDWKDLWLVGNMLKHIWLEKLAESLSQKTQARSSGSFNWDSESERAARPEPRVEMNVGPDGLTKSWLPWPVSDCKCWLWKPEGTDYKQH